MNTNDIKNELIRKYRAKEFRYLYNGSVKTIEIQNAHFTCDKDYIIRKPNYDYAQREIEWYKSQSLFVDDIPGTTPKIWNDCADKDGKINSNYGWCIWSNENGNQYKNCLRTLIKDPHSRQAVMIYNRPSMHKDANENGRHDFMCTYAVQCFINDKVDDSIPGNLEPYYELTYIVYMRSNDAVFGFDNDILWHNFVASKLADDLANYFEYPVKAAPIEWNAASLHVYDRHFKFLEEPESDFEWNKTVEDWCKSRGLSKEDYDDIIANETENKYVYPNRNLTRQQVVDIHNGWLQACLNKNT